MVSQILKFMSFSLSGKVTVTCMNWTSSSEEIALSTVRGSRSDSGWFENRLGPGLDWVLSFCRCDMFCEPLWVAIKYESRPYVVGLLKVTFLFSKSFSIEAIKSRSTFVASDFEIWC